MNANADSLVPSERKEIHVLTAKHLFNKLFRRCSVFNVLLKVTFSYSKAVIFLSSLHNSIHLVKELDKNYQVNSNPHTSNRAHNIVLFTHILHIALTVHNYTFSVFRK